MKNIQSKTRYLADWSMISQLQDDFSPPPTTQPIGGAIYLGIGGSSLVPALGQEVIRGKWPPTTANPLPDLARTATQMIFREVQKLEESRNVGLLAIRENVEVLTREVAELRGEIARLQRSRTYVVPLTTLTSEFRMVHQIPVTVEGDGEEFTATFVEANLSASGETEADAIANFKESLISSYEILGGMAPDDLGPLPSRQWEILNDVIKRAR